MTVDVRTQIEIARPRSEVSAYAADPEHATTWYENIKSVEWRTPPPLDMGSQIEFVATFLGRRLAYTYEVVEHVPGERLRHAHGRRARSRWRPPTRGRTRPAAARR